MRPSRADAGDRKKEFLMKTIDVMRTALVALTLSTTVHVAGCAAPDEESEGASESEDGTEGDPAEGDDGEQVGTTSQELASQECTVRVMKPRPGSTGVSAASNAWGSCKKARGSTLHFMMRTKGFFGWTTRWDFNQNVPYTGSYNLGGRQVSLAAVSEIYAEATVCWKQNGTRRCRSDSAILRDLL
jgi:hypothetical protein